MTAQNPRPAIAATARATETGDAEIAAVLVAGTETTKMKN
jgi:hypothetical protein